MAVKFLNGIDVDGSMNIAASDVPNLDASKITSGTLSADRIPNLSGVYQPAGDYLDLETANTTFQPLGNYLTGISSADVTAALGYVPYQEGTNLSAYTINFANIEKTNIDLDGEMGWDANDVDAPATLGTYGSSYPDGLYLRGSGTLYTVYHTGHFSGTNIANWETAYGWGNHASAGYLTSLPSHNHDTLYDAIGSANAVGQALTERIDTEVFDAINSKQPAGNYFTDGDTVLNMANNDGLVYNDTNNRMYIKADGIDYPIIDSRGGDVTGSINMTGGGTKLSMNNGDIVGVNQLKINDPGEGIVWNNGSSGDITLAVVDDASDNRLNLAGTNASLSINNAVVATQSWVSSQGYLTSIPSTYATDAEVNTAVGAVDARIDNEVFPAINDLGNAIPTNNNQLTNGAGYLTSIPNNVTTFSYITLNNSTTTADFIAELTNEHGAFQDNYRAYKVGWSYAGNSDLNVGFEVVELAGCLIECYGGTYKHVRLTRPTTGTGGRSIYVYNDQGSSYAPGWRQIWTSDEFSNTNLSNWNTAYGWGDHSAAGYATTGYVDTAVSNLVDSAPGALNTLNELAAALGDDANFSTTVTNNIAAVDARINDEVFPALGDIQTAVDGKLDATAKAADSNLLDGINSTSFLRSDANDTKSGDTTFTGKVTLQTNLVITEDAPTISFLDTTSGADDFYIHVNSNNFYVLRDTAGSNTVDGGWDSPHPLQLEGDTNKALVFGNEIKSAAYQNTSAFDSAGSASTAQANAIAHADNRIDSEIQPAIDTIGGLASTAHGWGDHASAGYLTSVPSSLSVTSLAVGSTVTLTESTDRSDLLMIKSSTSTWGGLQISNTSNEIIFSLMGDGTTGGIYDDQNSDWLIQWTENAGVRLYHNAGQKLTTTSTGITVTGQVNATGGNSGNWNTAYGWGNHASAGYLTSIPSDYVRQAQDIVSGNIHPLGDREQLLGLDTNRWQVVFCEILDSAGQHEKNLQNPAGEKSVADYATGTVMVWENGKNVPCTTYANHMRMGIAVENVDSPMIQGAEPVLVTGTVVEGDYLVTSTTEGHAVAVSRDTVKQEQLWDCVIGKALEGGEGESHLIKTWVTI